MPSLILPCVCLQLPELHAKLWVSSNGGKEQVRHRLLADAEQLSLLACYMAQGSTALCMVLACKHLKSCRSLHAGDHPQQQLAWSRWQGQGRPAAPVVSTLKAVSTLSTFRGGRRRSRNSSPSHQHELKATGAGLCQPHALGSSTAAGGNAGAAAGASR